MKIRTMTPLRLGLAGGGTDVSPYCDEHGGAILNATINLYSYCLIESISEGKIIFQSPDKLEKIEFDSKLEIPVDHFFKLHAGVYNYVVENFTPNVKHRFTMTTFSDAPFGSGLGSSSTMVVAILHAFCEWLNIPLGEYELASHAYVIERKRLSLAGGKQDQYAAAFGGVNFMEFYANDRVIVNPLRVKGRFLDELQLSTVLYYTGVARNSAKVISDQTTLVTEKNIKTIEAMHNLKDEAIKIKEALLTSNMPMYIDCLRRGWEAKKSTSESVSSPVIEETMDVAMRNGALAGKVSGAGGGGFMMFVVDPVKRVSLTNALRELGGTPANFHFCPDGSKAWQVR